MAVREFNYEGAKEIITKIQNQADTIQTILNECEIIVNENVGVERKWTGTRANNFKNDWKKTTENFSKFSELIKEYSDVIESAHNDYREVDQ